MSLVWMEIGFIGRKILVVDTPSDNEHTGDHALPPGKTCNRSPEVCGVVT